MKNKTIYASVLLFDAKKTHALLIRKTHPEWQAGKLNLIGGKIEEGESVTAGAVREVYEESEIQLKEDELHLFRHYHPIVSDIEVFFYWAICNLDQAVQKTGEKLVLVDLNQLPPENTVHDVPLMISLARLYPNNVVEICPTSSTQGIDIV